MYAEMLDAMGIDQARIRLTGGHTKNRPGELLISHPA